MSNGVLGGGCFFISCFMGFLGFPVLSFLPQRLAFFATCVLARFLPRLRVCVRWTRVRRQGSLSVNTIVWSAWVFNSVMHYGEAFLHERSSRLFHICRFGTSPEG